MLKFLDQESKKIFMVLKKDIFVRVGETFTVIFTWPDNKNTRISEITVIALIT